MDIDAIYYEKRYMEEVIQTAVDTFETRTGLSVDEVQFYRATEIGKEKGRIYKAEVVIIL